MINSFDGTANSFFGSHLVSLKTLATGNRAILDEFRISRIVEYRQENDQIASFDTKVIASPWSRGLNLTLDISPELFRNDPAA